MPQSGPRIAAPLTKGSAAGKGVSAPGRRQEDDTNIVAVAKCLTTSQERQDYDTQDFVVREGVRRLTPVECERLQGFPDGWTIPDDTPWQEHPRPDGPRYAQMGNAVTVPVAEWIGRRIMEYG